MLSQMLAREIKKKTRGLWYRPRIEALEERMLLSSDTWTGGGGANTNWSNPANWDHGTPNPGDDLNFPGNTGGADLPYNFLNNDFPSGTTFHSLIFGPLPPPPPIEPPPPPPPPPFGFSPTLSGNAIVLTGGIICSNASITIALNGITIGADQSFSFPDGFEGVSSPVDLNGFELTGGTFSGPFSARGTVWNGGFKGPITLTGPTTLNDSAIYLPINLPGQGRVNLNGFDLTFDGPSNSSINGLVEGTGNIIYNGSGTMSILGPIENNGSVINNGSGTLSLNGFVVGSVNLLQGILHPQLPGQNPNGPLLTTGPLTFSPTSTFQVDLSEPTNGIDFIGQGGYPQVSVNGPVDLNGATLSANLNTYITPSPGAAFVLIQSTGQISGTFNGLPDGATLTLNNQNYQIHYYNPSPGWPGEVVLSNDARTTQTMVTSTQAQASSLTPPTFTVRVGNFGAGAVNGAPPPASGTVVLVDDSTTAALPPIMAIPPLGGPIPLVNGVATLPLLLTAGTHSIFAVYTPSDSSFLRSDSSAVDQEILPVAMGWTDVLTGDFTGDGKHDIVSRTAAGQWWVGVSNGSSGFSNQLWTTWNPNVTWVDVHVGDFNGDGKADIVGRWLEAGEWWVALSTGSSFTNQLWATWSPNATWADVNVGDFDGDGKADITGRWKEAGQWWTALSTGSSFNSTLWTTWSASVTWSDVKVADFNGDGKADITGRWLEGGSWWTGVSTGSSFTTSQWAVWSPLVTWADVQVGDFNGDGKADITGRWLEGGSWWTGISTGSSFTTTMWAQWSPNVTWVDVKVGDFNGDGKADITGRWLEGGSWWTAVSTGSSFATSQWSTWSTAVTWVDLQVGDFNGDGKAELTGRWLEAGQWWTATSSRSDFTNSLWTIWPT